MERHRLRLIVLGLIAIGYLAVLNARPDFTRFNASDSEFYLALADSLVDGRGYTRSLVAGDYVPHTTWPPGLPVLLMPAMAVSGDRVNWAAVKMTMVAVGLAGVALTWALTRRLTERDDIADASALAVALNPIYWDFSHQAMAEVPLTVWIVGGLLLVDRTWAGRRVGVTAAFLVGLVCGLGMLIKGHVGCLALAPLAYLGGPRRSLNGRGALAALWGCYLVGFVLPYGAWTLRNSRIEATGQDGVSQLRMLRQKDPNADDGELMSASDSVNTVVRNARTYMIYHVPAQTLPGLWLEPALSWKGSGFLALALTAAVLALVFTGGRATLPLHLAAWPMAALNLALPWGGSPRYWVPISTLLVIMLAIRLAPKLLKPDGLRWPVLAAVLALVVNLGVYIVHHERQPYNPHGPWRELAELYERVAQTPLETRGVRTSRGHSFQLMTGYPATGTLPVVDHAVVRLDGAEPSPPMEYRTVVTVHPWALIELRPGQDERLPAPEGRP